MGRRLTSERDSAGGHLNGFAVHRSDNGATNKPAAVDVELFAGAGGLALGLAEAGMAPNYLFELNKHCCATLRRNAEGPRPLITGEVVQTDLAGFSWQDFTPPVRLLSGGPPCQPFSLGGKHLADKDARNRFSDAIAAVRALKPAAVLFENVPGLARPSLRGYLNYLICQMELPSLAPKAGESVHQHLARIQKAQSGRKASKEYNVQCWVLNAADFGAAQVRVRVYLLATRTDFPAPLPPIATHSRAALQAAQLTGAYWKERGITKRPRDEWPRRATCEWDFVTARPKPWLTVRQALAGLPAPREREEEYLNHWLIPGARLYSRHSGSELDWPSKAIKAGVHGVAGGENVLLGDDESHRYFTLREMARLQGFPDDYEFVGPRSRIIGQIGNAVPCQIGKMLGKVILKVLNAQPQKQAPRVRGKRAVAHAWR